MAEELHLTLLGGLRLTLGDVPLVELASQKAQALLAYLTVTGRAHTRTALAGLFWADMPEADARTNLRVVLSRLNKAVPVHLHVTRDAIGLSSDAAYRLDVTAFEQQVNAAKAVPGRVNVHALREAAALYQGDFLEGFYVHDAPLFEEWVAGERTRLQQLALYALHLLAMYETEQGNYAEAIHATARLLQLDPWREDAHRQLMLLLARSGQRDGALTQYENLRRLLTDELGVEPDAETAALAEQIRKGQIEARPAHVMPQPALPIPPMPLLGREDDLVQIARLLSQPTCRLLTLSGPGGSGKTRLALEVARHRQCDFDQGVYFVDLTAIRDPALVVPILAKLIGLPESSQPIQDRLITWLRDKDVLLVLDNFEQVLSAAMMLNILLAHAPYLKILVTSRERLNVRGEHVYPVNPLAVPDLRHVRDMPLATLAQYPAVELFVQRAQAAKPEFQLTEDDAVAVAEICARLDGLPLALELAASRVPVLTPQAMVQWLNRRLVLLRGGPHDMPDRQRTLRATIAWSYESLNEEERRLFRRLAVFVGPMQLRAIAALCSEEEATVAPAFLPDLLDGVTSLVNKNLLKPAGEWEGEPRFRLLETIREYALEQLDAHGEGLALRQQHAHFYRDLAETAESYFWRAEQARWLAQLEAEYDNLRSALHWTTENAQAESLLRLSGALGYFWQITGRISEGRHWLQAGLAAAQNGISAAVRAKALRNAGRLAIWQDDQHAAAVYLEEAFVLYRQLGNQRDIGWTLCQLGWVAATQSEYTRAVTLIEEGLALGRTSGDQLLTMEACQRLGIVLTYQNDAVRAIPILEEGLALARQGGDPHNTAVLLGILGHNWISQGDISRALALIHESIVIVQQIGGKWFLIYPLIELASVALSQQEPMRAVRLLAAAQRLSEQIGVPIAGVPQTWYAQGVANAQALLDEDDYGQAWLEGQAMTQEQIVAYSLQAQV